MHRILTGLLSLVLAISLVGCGGASDEKAIKQSKSDTKKYSDEEILFQAQNRYDVEDDTYTVYSYNYKGELLKTEESSNVIGYYAENGLAPAIDPDSGKYGYVDKDGVFEIDVQYEAAAPFSANGLAAVSYVNNDNEKWGFIDSDGEEVVACNYDDVIGFFDSGYAAVGTVTDENSREWPKPMLYGIIDKNGKVIVEQKYSYISYIGDKYMLCELEDGTECIADFEGNILDKADDSIMYFVADEGINRYTLGFDEVYEEEYIIKYEIFNGKKFVDKFGGCEITSKKVATTSTEIGYGIEKDGETVIPFEYNYIYPCSSYFVAIKFNNGDYDEQIIDIYDSSFNITAENLEYNYSLRYGGYGAIDFPLPDGYFEVYVYNEDDERLCGIIDNTGKIIIEPVFNRVLLYSYMGMGKFSRNY